MPRQPDRDRVRVSTDDPVVIVGAGLAGLWAALNLVPRPVLLLAGGQRHRSSSSSWAQGGIAAALAADDRVEDHATDTIAAGAGLADPEVVRALTADAPGEVRALFDAGVPFERTADGGWVLSREAAHGRARIARVGGDRAGAAIVAALGRALQRRAEVDPSLRIRHGVQGTGLLADDHGRCIGVTATGPDGETFELTARAVVLATGGVGGLYPVTTNPPANQGQALAWAARLGARIRDAEFVQFHPTAMKLGRTPAPLATEALRGEGARLVDADGRRFMTDVHPDAELAPRDVVARAVYREAERAGAWLDARAIGPEFAQRFPTVFEACRSAGLDPREQPIPVAPAAHYHMGGIASALDGATDIEGLYAIGEAACTGAHGANRLASNSLLEAVVMASRTAAKLREDMSATKPGRPVAERSTALPEPALESLREAMQRGAGVERNAEGLAALLATLDDLQRRHGPADAVIAARCIAESAAARTESRGAHSRTDHPDPGPHPRHSEWQLEPLRDAPEKRGPRVSWSEPVADPESDR